MTKRSYIIIIALLVALDTATGFWYMANHLNSDGKSDIFDSRSGTVAAADTIADANVPDKFTVTTDHAYFVSKAPAVDGDAQTYYASIKRIKCKLPTEVNGSTNTEALLSAIAEKAFAKRGASIAEGKSAWLKTPAFNASDVDFKAIDSEPTITSNYGNVQGIKVYPVFSSRSYLVMAIDLTSYDGHKKSERMHYVSYDRRSQSVLTKAEIFAPNSSDAVLALLNKKIASLADDEDLPLSKASRLPSDLYARKNGVFFVYQPGEIADESEGVIELFLPFSALKAHFTASFKTLVAENGGYTNFKPIAFKQG